MKQFLATAFLTTVALFGLTQASEANCGKFRGCRGGCDAACAPACVTPAPVQYEDRKVTVYKQVITEKEIDVLECKRVYTEEKYYYTVCVPVTRQEKRVQIVCTPTYKDVEYTYTVMVPHTVQKKVQCTTYQCVRETVVVQVPVCRTVCVTCVDECGRCYTRRERVTTMEEQTRCIVKRIPIVTEQVINVTVCEPEIRKGKKTICEIVRTEQPIMVNVCSFEHQKREGTRQVCSIVTEKVKRKVQVCEMVAHETVVRVAVHTSSCYSECSTPSRGGLFRRGGHGHSRGASCCN